MRKNYALPQKGLALSDNSYCAICGKPIEKHGNYDHFIPRAVYKWTKNYIPEEEYIELKSRINGNLNYIPAHISCNKQKEDTLYNAKDLFLSAKEKRKIYSFLDDIKDCIDIYYQGKEMVRARQNNKCYSCGKELNQTAVLRRIDSNKRRTWENACVVCHDCNIKCFLTYRFIVIHRSSGSSGLGW